MTRRLVPKIPQHVRAAGRLAIEVLREINFRLIARHREVLPLTGVVLLNRGLSNTMQRVIYDGNYEAAERRILDTVPRDSRVLEIGSAIGYLGLYARLKLGFRHWHHVEPSQSSVATLKANYERNGLSANGCVLRAALTSRPGVVKLRNETDLWESRIADTGEDVQGMPLAELVEQCPFRPDVLVIDVEGSENCLIGGPLLAPDIRHIVIELHPRQIGLNECFEIVRWMMGQGFDIDMMEDWVLSLRRIGHQQTIELDQQSAG
jgi:FkbM family methyltransferase